MANITESNVVYNTTLSAKHTQAVIIRSELYFFF